MVLKPPICSCAILKVGPVFVWSIFGDAYAARPLSAGEIYYVATYMRRTCKRSGELTTYGES